MRYKASAIVTLLLLSACVSAPKIGVGPDGRLTGLAGTEWLLETIGGAVPPAEASIAFEDERRVRGRSGCNIVGGRYRLDGETLSIEATEMTEMACDEPAMQLEAAFIRALADTRRARTSEGRLVLVGADGTALATFIRRGAD